MDRPINPPLRSTEATITCGAQRRSLQDADSQRVCTIGKTRSGGGGSRGRERQQLSKRLDPLLFYCSGRLARLLIFRDDGRPGASRRARSGRWELP